MVQHFSDWPRRAVQAWMILVGMAMNRQTTTCAGLSNLMYNKETAAGLGNILGHIACYCDDNELPRLNILVVGKNCGTPEGTDPLDPNEIDAIREAVYATNWYDIVPPNAEDLAGAFNSRKRLAG